MSVYFIRFVFYNLLTRAYNYALFAYIVRIQAVLASVVDFELSKDIHKLL